jgi:serine/threonine-protein kinase SRPK3
MYLLLKLWTMVEGTNLFTDNKGGRWKSALPHMARMISLLGPPPQDLLDVTPVTKAYFDKNGTHLSPLSRGL